MMDERVAAQVGTAKDMASPLLARITDHINEYVARINDESYTVEDVSDRLLGGKAEISPTASTKGVGGPTMFGGLYGELESAVQRLETATERLNLANKRLRSAA